MTAPKLATQVSSVSSRLSELLDAELDYSPGARGQFVNHLAMTLVAADRLGASNAQLWSIYQSHTKGDFLLRRSRPAWLEKQTTDVARQGIARAVAARVPALVDALDARWFHAVIRLEHAIDAEHPGQVANALGDWEQVGKPLPELPSTLGNRRLVEVAREMEATSDIREFGDMQLRAVASHPTFHAALARVRLGSRALDDAAELALLAHIAGSNIGTLHLVTGARAARAVAQVVPEPTALALSERLVQAIFAGYLSYGSRQLPSLLGLEELRSRALPDWTSIGKAALASDDAHVIKLSYACLREQQATGERLYQWLAARDSGLL